MCGQIRSTNDHACEKPTYVQAVLLGAELAVRFSDSFLQLVHGATQRLPRVELLRVGHQKVSFPPESLELF